jgi:hypothetical protein
VLTPAYGRVYNNKAEIEKDWLEGKDFRLNCMGNSAYCSKSNFTSGERVQVRYGKRLEKTTTIVA